MNTPRLSVLVSMGPGREKQLLLSLQSLTKTAYDVEDVELIVFLDYVDTEKTVRILKAYRKWFRSISCFALQQEKRGVSHSATRRNFLAKKATGEFLLFTEPEMFHVGNTIPLAMASMTTGDHRSWYYGPVYATEKVVAKDGSFVINDNKKVENIPHILTVVKEYGDNFFSSRMKRYFFRISEKKYPPLFFCTMIHREFFFMVGGLNQNLKVRGWEELEFFDRFQRRGGHLSFDSRFITCHLPHIRTLSLLNQIGWDLYNSTVTFDRHQDTGALEEDIVHISI